MLEELLREKGDSKYAAPARLLMAQGAGVKPTRSLAELIQEAAKDFDPQWMHLASSPKGGELGDPVIVARQIVALSKDRDAYIEIAFGLVDKLAAREGYSKEDVEKAKAQVAYCFLETARARREFWPDTISCAQFMADRCRESGDCRGARRLYEAVLGLTGVSAEMRAMSEYGLALCFMDEHRDDAAKRAMLRVLERYPDTQAAKKVRGRLWAGGGQQTE
ncbi:MAG: hypothetical protein K6U00_04710 [Armatimonadetes bacterium]|nr:hypothetical protein [Armatimonadota bacterium]